MKFLTTINRLCPYLLLLVMLFSAPLESVAQSKGRTGKSVSARGASKRKTTKAAKKGRTKGKTTSAAKRKKPVAKKGGAKVQSKSTASSANKSSAAVKKTRPTSSTSNNNITYSSGNNEPRYASSGAPSDIAYSSPQPTASASQNIAPNEPVSMRSILEKNDQEILQELFGFDSSNRDTAFTSPYWLGQMRFTIPEQYAKIFPKGTVYDEGKALTIYDMDATQRILPLSKQYEGYIVTPHADPKNFYLYLYNRVTKQMLPNPQKVANEYSTASMRYKTYSYVFEEPGNSKLKMMNCTRSTRIDSDTCLVNCSAEYRIEGFEFNNGSWQSKYTIQQSRKGTDVVGSTVSCGDGSLRQYLEARANAVVSYYFRKKD
jgi:hypothetical protein